MIICTFRFDETCKIGVTKGIRDHGSAFGDRSEKLNEQRLRRDKAHCRAGSNRMPEVDLIE